MIISYNEAQTKLGTRESRKLAHNTYLQRRDETTIAVRLHNTDIVTFKKDGRVILNSDGWRTVTTKARINEFSPVNVSSTNGVWMCSVGMTSATFADGITYRMTKTGVATFSHAGKAPEKQLQQRKRVRKYAAEFVSKLVAGEIPAPSNGDCFYCLMHEVKTGKPLGEVTRDKSHIESHISERYFVPSLIVNALKSRNVGVVYFDLLSRLFSENNSGIANDYAADLAKRNFPRFLTRYLYSQLGMVR